MFVVVSQMLVVLRASFCVIIFALETIEDQEGETVGPFPSTGPSKSSRSHSHPLGGQQVTQGSKTLCTSMWVECGAVTQQVFSTYHSVPLWYLHHGQEGFEIC